MDTRNLILLAVAVLLQAPFAFAAGAVVRDGRELLYGILFSLLGGGAAAFVHSASGTALAAVPAALGVLFILTYARYAHAHPRKPVPSLPSPPPVPASPPPVTPALLAPSSSALVPAAVPPPASPTHAASEPPQQSSILTTISFIGDVLETADRIGEFRHRKRLRELERLRAARQAGGPARQLYVRVGARREPLFRPPPK